MLFYDCLCIPQKYLKYLRKLAEFHTISGSFALNLVHIVLALRSLVCLDFKKFVALCLYILGGFMLVLK